MGIENKQEGESRLGRGKNEGQREEDTRDQPAREPSASQTDRQRKSGSSTHRIKKNGGKFQGKTYMKRIRLK